MALISNTFHPGTADYGRTPPEITMPLSMATARRPLRLISVQASHKLTRRLAELGLTPGVTLTVVQDAGGPLLISTRGSRIAIGRGLAHKLLVMPV